MKEKVADDRRHRSEPGMVQARRDGMGEGRSGEKSAKERVYAYVHRPSRVEPRETTSFRPYVCNGGRGTVAFFDLLDLPDVRPID